MILSSLLGPWCGSSSTKAMVPEKKKEVVSLVELLYKATNLMGMLLFKGKGIELVEDFSCLLPLGPRSGLWPGTGSRSIPRRWGDKSSTRESKCPPCPTQGFHICTLCGLWCPLCVRLLRVSDES